MECKFYGLLYFESLEKCKMNPKSTVVRSLVISSVALLVLLAAAAGARVIGPHLGRVSPT